MQTENCDHEDDFEAPGQGKGFTQKKRHQSREAEVLS